MNNKYAEEFYQIVKEDPKKYFEDYKNLQKRIDSDFKEVTGKVVNNLYQGYFYNKDEKEFFSQIADMLMNITRKVTDHYLKDESYRKLFNFPKVLEDLIMHDPKYDIPVPICRYDMFYMDRNNIKFCEFNTDGTSAMNEEYIIGRELESSLAMKKFNEKYKSENINTFEPWVEESINIYKKYCNKKEKPNVAIVDFMDVGTQADFVYFKKFYEKAGYNCEICDIRDLKYKDGKLMYNDYKIDLIYRRFVTIDFLNHIDQLEDFIKAYYDDAFIMLGSFRSHIMHSKLIFYALLKDQSLAFLNDEEQEFVKKHIPFTDILSKNNKDEVIENKDQYIIKPFDGYALSGVFVGKDHSPSEWEKIVNKALETPYIYQEYVNQIPKKYVDFTNDGQAVLEDYFSVVGLYIYNEKFIAPYTRIGKENVVGGTSHYFVAPNILIC